MPGVEIIPDLWIGSLAAYNNSAFQEDNNISCLINCCKDLHFLGKYREYNMPIKNTMEKYEIDKIIEILSKSSGEVFETQDLLTVIDDRINDSDRVKETKTIKKNIGENTGIKEAMSIVE